MRDYREGIRAGLPFVLPTIAIGISFGVLAQSQGWGVVAPIVASLIIFSGSAQFAIAGVLAAGGGVATAVVAAALVNARFLPMGIAVAPWLRGGRWRRAAEGQAIIDTSWAMANKGGRFDRELMLGATLPQWLAWEVGTIIGAVAGSAIGNPADLGLDAMFPAFFLALLWPELRTRDARITAALALAVTVVLIPLVPAGLPIVAASLAAVLIGLRRS